MLRSLSILVALSLAAAAFGEVRTRVVEYREGETTLRGFLAWDDAAATERTPRPGVLVFHEWWGLNDYAKRRALELAELGYVAFAVDMYGLDEDDRQKVTTDPSVAAQWAGDVMGDTALRRARAEAGLKVLAGQPFVDAARIAAIGYCMGGTLALDLARTGADLKGVVAFHASQISAANPAENLRIRGSVLICHGHDDEFVQPAELAKFHSEMRSAGVDYVFVSYAGAVHSFTNPDADGFNIPSVGYDAKADKRSWEHMKSLLAEAFRRESA